MGVMDILPDQTPIERIKRTVVNRKTGEMLPTCTVNPEKRNVPLYKNDAFQKVQKRRVPEKR